MPEGHKKHLLSLKLLINHINTACLSANLLTTTTKLYNRHYQYF